EDTSASGAKAPEGKTTTDEKKNSESAATEAIGASEAKETDKGKALEATESEEKTTTEKNRSKSTKKPSSVKKRAPRVQRKMVIQSDDEETQEEPTFKRKRTEPEKVQPTSEDKDTEANTGISNSPNNNVPVFQAHTPPISSPLNQFNDDIDPALLQPINELS
ncbi:hypothetical protein A2U01_0042242, partial [Trifolium medium]|nr:hypothetical protein [Trifolium medium]